jgi:hypothetical protein
MLDCANSDLSKYRIREIYISADGGAIRVRPAERRLFDVCNRYPHRFVSQTENGPKAADRLLTILLTDTNVA